MKYTGFQCAMNFLVIWVFSQVFMFYCLEFTHKKYTLICSQNYSLFYNFKKKSYSFHYFPWETVSESISNKIDKNYIRARNINKMYIMN